MGTVRRSSGAGPALKSVGLVLAWVGGAACGWNVFRQSNLLEAVLRGAGAWLALLVIWLTAVSLCQRYILSQAPGPRTTGISENGRMEPGEGMTS